jgi:hypothetical protein
MVVDVANAPVFGPSDVNVDHGEVGGYLHSFAREGQIVGTIAVRVLNGEKPKDIPIVQGANAYMFDWRALRHWGFREKDLPPGSEVLFRPATLWQRTPGNLGSCIGLHALSQRSCFVRPFETCERTANDAQWHVDYSPGK